MDQHTGGSRLTPTVHRCPKGMAVGGSSPQHKAQQYSAETRQTLFFFLLFVFVLFFVFFFFAFVFACFACFLHVFACFLFCLCLLLFAFFFLSFFCFFVCDSMFNVCRTRTHAAVAAAEQQPEGWRFVLDTILPGYRWVPARTPTVHWGPISGKAVGGPNTVQHSSTVQKHGKHGSGALAARALVTRVCCVMTGPETKNPLS